MPDITVTFWGICTIIHADEEVERPRIVLVAAGENVIKQHPRLQGIQPHVARLHIPTSDIAAIGPLVVAYSAAGDWMRLDLDSVNVAISNATGNLEMEASCLPHLQALIGDKIDLPRGSTVAGGAAIACIFELSHGLLRGVKKKKGGAGLSVLTAQSDGDPVLSITPFGTTSPSTITLKPGARILITNLPEHEAGDNADDFLLHYLTLSMFPARAGIPSRVPCPIDETTDTAGLDIYVGPGCSNSNYP